MDSADVPTGSPEFAYEAPSLTEVPPPVKSIGDARPAHSEDSAARGSLILNRLEPAPDQGPGFRRDPETGFVYYSSEWLSDGRVEGYVLKAVK